ncbi:Organ specific protein [Cynara cardunculus var. scolymus]|uniref:Organ specific protein n=1 Tax=Cynara cardunculus var. scolymus TaxID=59895 RepID=A0A124SHU9_CYNCS|nr:Organ specific protein [Cynara cardunculus var. scolymus]
MVLELGDYDLGRPNPVEYKQESFVGGDTQVSPLPTKKTHCHTLTDTKDLKISFNHKHVNSDGGYNDQTTFDKDFEPRPDATVYDNGAGLKGTRSFDKDFEPRPDATVYDNGTGLKGTRSFDKDFEPRPDATVYDNGTGLRGKRSFDKDFEPRPDATVYDNETGLKGTRSSAEDKVIASVTGFNV